jgi:hypothetical protein
MESEVNFKKKLGKSLTGGIPFIAESFLYDSAVIFHHNSIPRAQRNVGTPSKWAPENLVASGNLSWQTENM